MFANAFGSFAVSDVRAARAFYGEMLGIRTSEEDGLLTLHLAGDRSVLVYLGDERELRGAGSAAGERAAGERVARRSGRADR